MERIICKFCNLKSVAAQKLNDDEIGELNSNCSEARFKTGDIIIKQNALSTNVSIYKIRPGQNSCQRAHPGKG